ncbi:MAG: hypothetical protein JW778_00930 [Candidatus Altiarchaeota archaeon]|nr:hypothetical protein [Candidatus Altiarchaeota archaeon]
MPYKKVESIRSVLGDFAHIYFHGLYELSLLYVVPAFAAEFYKIGKFIGYYSAYEAIETLRLEKLVNALSKTALFWEIFQNSKVQAAQKRGWRAVGAAVIDLTEIDKEKRMLKYVMDYSVESIFHNTSKPTCFLACGILCGNVESLFGDFCDGIETKCRSTGDLQCEIEAYLHEREEKPKIIPLTRDEADTLLNELIGYVINKRILDRKELGDSVHIISPQCQNYLLLSISPGHAVLSRYAGRVCGERIARESELQGLENALEYLEDLFLHLKAGILQCEKRQDRLIIRMRESVYASGVNNIHMNLCIFLAGIMEGILNEVTDKKWDVNEIKCIASGFSECEFWCKTI